MVRAMPSNDAGLYIVPKHEPRAKGDIMGLDLQRRIALLYSGDGDIATMVPMTQHQIDAVKLAYRTS
jgi:hypothetical protein